jgi:hypothetical protein
MNDRQKSMHPHRQRAQAARAIHTLGSPQTWPSLVTIRLSGARFPQAAWYNPLRTATYVLMGLRYSPELATQILQGVRAMKESSTYQAIIEEGRVEGREEGRVEGRVEEARAILLRQGTKRFGPPTPQAQAALEAIIAIDRLELLSERLLDVESRHELLAG